MMRRPSLYVIRPTVGQLVAASLLRSGGRIKIKRPCTGRPLIFMTHTSRR